MSRYPLPTIYIDRREKAFRHRTGPLAGRDVGIDLLPIFQKHRESPTCMERELIAGDICFSGDGPKGPCLIGIERKRTRDMLTSIRSERFSGEQLPKLLDHYDFTYLVLEARIRTNWRTGVLEEKKGPDWSPVHLGTEAVFVGLELDSFLTSIALRTPIRIIRTNDAHETVEACLTIAHSFAKPWDEHRAHIGIYTPDPAQMVTLSKASTVRRVANQLHGIGWTRSGAVDTAFQRIKCINCLETDPKSMCGATLKVWQGLEGFGKIMAARAYKELKGEHEDE
jgi:ERCC4-type nuclease